MMVLSCNLILLIMIIMLVRLFACLLPMHSFRPLTDWLCCWATQTMGMLVAGAYTQTMGMLVAGAYSWYGMV